jgi:hypothetical protein
MNTLETAPLVIWGVEDRGVPNQERVILRPTMTVDLSSYFVGVGVLQYDGSVLPFNDFVYWLPGERVDPSHWIFLYTGAGQTAHTSTDTNEPALVMHWGRSTTIFDSAALVPFVARRSDQVIIP